MCLLGAVLIPKVIQIGAELAKSICMGRYYFNNSPSCEFDPRYLLFEFVWQIQLRKKQVEIVNNFRENLARGNNGKVKQMIMV